MLKRVREVTVILITVVVMVATNIFFAEPVYEATSTLLCNPPSDAPTRPIKRGSGGSVVNLSLEEFINSEIQVLTGANLAENVIRTMTLTKLYPILAGRAGKVTDPLGEAVQLFQKSLTVKRIPKSNVVTITFRHPDPKVAARCVNVLVASFQRKDLLLHYDAQSSFINSQFISVGGKLSASERELQESQRRHRAFSLQQRRSLGMKQRMEFDAAYKEAIRRTAELQAKVEAIRSLKRKQADNRAGYTSSSRDQIIINTAAKKLELEVKEQETRRKYSDSNRFTVDAKTQNEMVKKVLKEEEERVAETVKTANPVHQQLEIELVKSEADLSSQVARAERLRDQLRQLETELASLDSKDLYIKNLKRNVALNEKYYLFLAEKLEEARLGDALNSRQIFNIRVLEIAVPPVQPIGPNKMFDVFLAAVLGLAAGVSYGWLAETSAGKKKHPIL